MNLPPPLAGLLIASLMAAALVSLLAFAFVLRYRRVDYRRTPEGRHLIRFTLLIAFTYGLTAALPVLEVVPPLVRVLVSLGLFSWAALEMYARNALFTEAQHAPDMPCPCPHHQPHDPEED